MNNYFSQLRLRQLFENQPTFEDSYNSEGSGIPDETMNIPASQFDETMNIPAGIPMDQYQPETTSIDRFNDMSSKFPQYQQPGKLRHIAAAALGTLGDLYGGGVGRTAYDEASGRAGHARKVTDWKNQMAPLETAANIERQTNSNNRTAFNQDRTNDLAQQRIDATTIKNENTNRVAEERNAIARLKAIPGIKLIYPKGGNVMVVKADGSTHDTGISTGTMTQADMIDTNQTNAIARDDNRAENAQNLLDDRQEGTQSDIVLRGDQSRLTRISPTISSTTATAKGELPSQTRIRQAVAANQLKNTRPDLAPFIEITGTNEFNLIPHQPGGGWYGLQGASGPTLEQAKEIRDTIYATSTPAPATVPTPPARTGGPGGNTGLVGGRLPVPNANGLPGGPGGTGVGPSEVMQKNVRNKASGEMMVVYSTDGGRTWNPR